MRPRIFLTFAAALFVLAGMSGLLAWLAGVPARDQLLTASGSLERVEIADRGKGAYRVSLRDGGGVRSFYVEGARDWDSATATRGASVTVGTYMFGRSERVADLYVGALHVLDYADVARAAESKAARERAGAAGYTALGLVLVAVGALIWTVSPPDAPPAPGREIGLALWVVLAGLIGVVMITEPVILHRAFGRETFGWPTEYAVVPAVMLLLLPLLPGCMGFGEISLQAFRKGRAGKFGLAREIGEAVLRGEGERRRAGLRAVWFFAYLAVLAVAWILYADRLGI